jgi:transposase-like protein
MKYSFELKKEIYEKHCEGYGGDVLSKEYGLSASKIRYLCRLIDKHGIEAIRPKYTKYSNEYKLVAITRVLVNGEPVDAVAVDLGLTSDSVLRQWIKSYIENGYNVVTKKKGRASTRDKGKEDTRGAGEGERRTSRAIVEEDYRGRIIKKLQALAQEEEKKKKSN